MGSWGPNQHEHMGPMWAIGGQIAIWVLYRIYMVAKGPGGEAYWSDLNNIYK